MAGRDPLPRVVSDAAPAFEAVTDLRATRRRRRVGDVAWGDMAYRVYTASFAGLVMVVFLAGLIGDRPLGGPTVDEVARRAPAWAGVLLAVAALAGVRSGRRGGPLSMEAADVHHLLSAPIARRTVLRRPLLSVLGYGLAGGAVVGAIAGGLAAQRLPGADAAWLACGALFGAMVMASATGAALVAGSRALPPLVPVAVAVALLAWAVLDVAGVVTGAPTSHAASVVRWPLRFDVWPLLAVVVLAAVVVWGAWHIGGLSIEAARRRTDLVGQIRFAVTQQDLRSVVLLRRQLADERPRATPILRLPTPADPRFAVEARDLQSVLRWPAVRALRVLVLGAGAGLALHGVAAGTTPLLLLAGVALYVAALDALEPLAQEVDHPTLRCGYPMPTGLLFVRHLAVPVGIMGICAAVAVVVARLAGAAAGDATNATGFGPILVLTAATAAVAGGAISIVSEVPVGTEDQLGQPVEIAGPRVLMRLAWPPVLATAGCLPVLVAVRAQGDSVSAVRGAAGLVLASVGVVLLWVRYREDLRTWMAEAGKVDER